MYNASQIEEFIKKVNKEAEQAAQKVFDSYDKEFNRRIEAQLKKGDRIFAGMGLVSIENSKGEYVGKKLSEVLTQTEYWGKNIKSGLSVDEITKK